MLERATEHTFETNSGQGFLCPAIPNNPGMMSELPKKLPEVPEKMSE